MNQSQFLNVLPKDIVHSKHEMGMTYQRIAWWSFRHYCLLGLMGLFALIIAITSTLKVASLVLIGLMITLHYLVLFRVRDAYRMFKDKRNVEFLYFFMILVPHLSGMSGMKTGLYRILTKLELRLEHNEDSVLKQGVNRLILQMTNQPGQIKPFLEFARTCSGSELAEDVAVALFDFQQSSDDHEAIHRLKEKVDRAINHRIEEIVEIKLSRFRWYSTRVVMSVFVLILGILGSSIWAEIVKAFSVMR